MDYVNTDQILMYIPFFSLKLFTQMSLNPSVVVVCNPFTAARLLLSLNLLQTRNEFTEIIKNKSIPAEEKKS